MWGMAELAESKSETLNPYELKGYVHRYFPDIKMGTLRTDSMDSYAFSLADWATSEIEPKNGQRVTFTAKGHRASNVKLDSNG